MMRRCLSGLIVLAAAVLLIGCEGSDESSAGGIIWESNYQAGMQQAKQENKAVLLFFTATWCPPCNQMKKTTFKDATVKAFIESKFVPIYLDDDKEKALSSQYDVQFLPTYCVLKPDGSVAGRFSGYYQADGFVGELKKRLAEI
jgi:thiol:disulfide interchange protein